MDKIIIRNLVASGIIGVHDGERNRAQDVRINLELFGPLQSAAAADCIEMAVDYEIVCQRVQGFVAESGNFLLETLAAGLCDLVLREFSAVVRVRVRVEKTGVIPAVEAVGVEIERARETA